MNKKIVILFLILILIITATIIGYLIYLKTTAPSTAPSTVSESCPGNKDSFYDFKEVQLGKDILSGIREGFKFVNNFIRTKIMKETFALSTGIISLDDIRAGRATLDPNIQYYRGIRNVTSTITPSSNGGKGCVEYPDVVFKPVPPSTTISGSNGWKYVKDIGVISAVRLNLNGDIICASNDGVNCLVKSEADLLTDINNTSYTPANIAVCNKFQYTQGSSFTQNNLVVQAHPCNKLIQSLLPNGPNYKNSITYTNNVLSNQGPCASFTDSSNKVNVDCIKHIWTNLAGCPNYRDDIINYYYSTSQNNGMTKGAILRDAQAWSTLNDSSHRTACYGTDTTKWPTS